MGSCVTQVVSRVTGFFSNVEQYNHGKRAEHSERKKFDEAFKKKGKDTQIQTR